MMAASPLTGSNEGKFTDEFPGWRPAGKVLTDLTDNVHRCMTYGKPPVTPPAMLPYRKSVQNAPGTILQHPGKAKDPPPPEGMRFGHINHYADNAKDLIGGKEESAFAERARALKESSKGLGQNEPLGKSCNKYNIQLPEECKDPNYTFGTMMVGKADPSAKELIYPTNDPYDNPDEKTHQMYVKTHGQYEAAEQKKMGYNWLAHGIDPMSFRFGQVEKNYEPNGVAQALKTGQEKLAKTSIVKMEVEAFKDVTQDALGQPKNYGYGSRALGPDFAFGRKNKTDEWDAQRCMQGDYSLADQRPDANVAKATRPGYRNFETARAFGVPTVRDDIRKPKNRRVTDFQNYGDEPKAEGVMYPSKYQAHCVHAEDFATGYTKEFMWDLQKDAGIGLNEEEFETVWDLAKTYTPDGSVCVETFRRAMTAAVDP